MSSIRYIIQTGLFCQDPDYLVWIPEDPFGRFHGMDDHQSKRHTDFLCPYCVKPMHVYQRVPNPPKDGVHAAECPVHCPLRGTPLPVSLLSENGYGTQSVQMSWNENRKRASVDSIAARPGTYDCRSAEDNGHPLEHDSPS